MAITRCPFMFLLGAICFHGVLSASPVSNAATAAGAASNVTMCNPCVNPKQLCPGGAECPSCGGCKCECGSQVFANPEMHVAEVNWPAWPKESEAIGASHGPFPFWCDTSNQTKGAYKFTCLDRGVDHGPSRTRLLYSYSRMQQITYRDNCDLTHFGGEKGVQCAHRFMPNGHAFITYGDSQDGFCCQSFGHLPQSNPIPIPHPNYMDTCMRKTGPFDYNGEYYQGKVYNYTDEFAELPNYFWYITAVDEKNGEWPVEQGEGCTMDWNNRAACTNAGAISKLGPKYGDPPPMKFEYEQFIPTVFADAEFDLPPVCKTDKLKQCWNMECEAPAPQNKILKMRSLDPTFTLPQF